MTDRAPATAAPIRCPSCGEPLYRGTDPHVVICVACCRDYVVETPNDYLLAAPHYAKENSA